MQTSYIKGPFQSKVQALLNKGQYLPGQWDFSLQYVGLEIGNQGVANVQGAVVNSAVGVQIDLNQDVKYAAMFNLVYFTVNAGMTILPINSVWYRITEKTRETFTISFVNLSTGENLVLPEGSQMILQVAFREIR